MGNPVNLYALERTEDLTKQLRSYVRKAEKAALDKHGVFRIAISGGSLAKALANALLSAEDSVKISDFDFQKWEIFFADERCVPLDHEDSNYKLVKDEILDKIPESLGKPKVYAVDTHHLDDVQKLAEEYESTLVHHFAARDSVLRPTFDLTLLGCGPDGHTCSLFPGSPLLRESTAWVLPISDSPKPPLKRITLSLPVVTHSLKIGFVATGAGKNEILKKIFDTTEGQHLPCGLVNSHAQERVSWFCDEAAVKGVAFQSRRGSL